MSGHTPGPWRLETGYEEDGGKYNIHAANGICVALSVGGTRSEDANALLIAAAPELLEALNAYQKAFDGIFAHCLSNGVFNAWQKAMDCTALNDARQSACAAIAKATGQ